MKQPLTSRQEAVFQFIKAFIAKHKYPPTRQEIATAFNFASVNAAQEHVIALEKKGWIKVARASWARISRGLSIV